MEEQAKSSLSWIDSLSLRFKQILFTAGIYLILLLICFLTVSSVFRRS